MRRILAVTVLGLCLAHPSAAQSADWPEKMWFSISGGVQPATHNFSDAFDISLNVENEHVSVAYPVKGGTLVAASGGYRVWKQLAMGLCVTRSSSRGSASVSADVPHPFFFQQFRHVQGTTSTTRSEVAAHVLIGWMIPVTGRIRLIVSAGPSAVSVGQTLVSDVQYSQDYPYDTATFTGATTTNATKTAIGFNAGADVFWMFSHNLGAGALAQITGASLKENRGSSASVSVTAGGAQVGAGLRVVF